MLTLTGSPALALEKATVQLKWLHHFQFAGYYAALETGFYREAGLDVTLVEGGPQVEVEQTVLDGRADFGVGTSALLLHRAKGEDLVVLAQVFQHSPAIFLTPRKTGIRTIADRAGARVMFSNQHGDLLALLKKNGTALEQIVQVLLAREGVGSTFAVILPFERSVTLPQTVPTDPEASGAWGKERLDILLAEDNEINQTLLLHMLQLDGHRITLAANGAEALANWEMGELDLILMDIQMPGIDGIEATGIIRQREAGSGDHTPIIALTARAMREDQELILGKGFDSYIAKPFKVKTLQAEIRRCLGLKKRRETRGLGTPA